MQRMAQVSIRYNRMLNRQKESRHFRKDLDKFIQEIRNGNNPNFNKEQTTAAAQKREISPLLYDKFTGRDRSN